jgi:YegS/Rv2252/BmrU family lipid kinase
VRYKVIVNPLAGRGYGGRCLPKIESLLSEHEIDFDLVTTSWAGEAVALARQAVLDGYDTVVAAGGDGTFQEVANGIMEGHAERSAVDLSRNGDPAGTLGVLPVGSGSDFAYAMGVPFDLEQACSRLVEQQTKTIDLAWLTIDSPTRGRETRYFDNTLGIGFEGVVTIEGRNFKRLRGIALYLPLVLKSIFLSLTPVRSVIEYTDDEGTHRLEDTFMLIDVCNGARAGGSFFIAPDAKTDDGMLNLCIMGEMSRPKMLSFVPLFLKGTHVSRPEVTMGECRHVVITSEDDLIAHADGELVCTDAHRIECEIMPQQIKVVC